MELFDKKFVHFMWDDELEGKEGFFDDDICELTNCVHSGNMHRAKVRKSLSPAFPFKDTHDNDWLFFYYDPNYEVKKAFNEGKKVQYQLVGGVDWADIDSEEELECRITEERILRIKPEDEKCIVYLQQYDEECWLSTCYECEWEKAQKEKGAKTKLFVGSEDEVMEWFKSRQKFAKVIKAWEDGKEIQFRPNDSHLSWQECQNPSWHSTFEYRIKPEKLEEEKKRFRPYESSAEMIADFIDRFDVNCPPYYEPLIWVKGKESDNRFLMTVFTPKDGVCLGLEVLSFKNLFNYYTYLDGSPCGMEVKERLK